MRIRDAALPAGLAAVVAAVALAGADSDDRALAPWGWALILASTAALLWRRRLPIAVLLVTAAACVTYYPLGFPDTPIALSLVVALYTVARERGPLPSGAAAAGLLLVVTATASAPLPTAASVAPLLALPVVLGEVIRGRAHRTAQAEERATLAEAARRSAEASREAEALRRATEERLRISREVHDALGHQLSLISVQAGAALHTRSVDGAFAALQAIRTASGDALRDLREVLGVLREPVRPALAALPELLDRTSATGLTVRSAIEVPDPPPDPVQQAAYRIVQEAITNAVRHATAATTIDVAVHLTPTPAAPRPSTPTGHHGPPRMCGSDRWLVVVVENDGAEVAAMAEGGGIRGMAERAAALGGTVTAGPRPRGGFRVEAHLPVDRIETGSCDDAGSGCPPTRTERDDQPRSR
ncbi:sensor histidine kinase [Actinoplanes xinjiangensis]|uniref:sensor histidine kinase n=1 Tax=Actinoplanes xinjiangensis TaxID=512350 RepID=UPI00343D102C